MALLLTLQALGVFAPTGPFPAQAASAKLGVAAADTTCRTQQTGSPGHDRDGSSHCAVCCLRDDDNGWTDTPILSGSFRIEFAPRLILALLGHTEPSALKREARAGAGRARAPPALS
ncbi:hypothetical protein [Methylocystis bryophila]|uniref:hypothetical protein n=1 Tax=Methylocystis bryophila TaxID=655015 RepID=UPI00131A27FD|nr:hypothetical protein [Methylocystis bryophila]BDV37065.1 hypothetical protein DSM21852_03180 [Methylocystis bryophila]